ncbi:MAG TPA: hypothetical protein DD725_05715 [Deltaproteobacteria bacterium]|nr:hypothetical protein [Deltaproteobacteria bacterium]
MNLEGQSVADADLQADLQASVPKICSELTNTIDEKVKLIFSDIALKIILMYEWITGGAKNDDNKQRIDTEYYSAAKSRDKIIGKPRRDALKELTEHQAFIFWFYKGSIKDNNIERMRNDYYDGKRYVGFLIADKLIEGCKQNQLDDDCLGYLKEEYFEYLVALSVEEYIRIKAYYNWGNKNKISNNDLFRMNSDYYNAMECLHNTFWNCKGRTPELFLDLGGMKLIKGYLLNIDKYKLNIIKKAKNFAGKRLNYEISSESNEFVDKFYKLIQDASKGIDIRYDEIFGLLNLVYEDDHVPNMLEFILRCFFCTYITRDVHNIIRESHYKTPLEVSSVPLTRKQCNL